jgi:signal transduction histidine kinase
VPAVKQKSKESGVQLKIDHEALLQKLLDEMQDGVIVCAPDATVALFNKTAAGLFGGSHSISLGVSLYTLCLQSPVEHALELLLYQEQENTNDPDRHYSIQFINAATNNGNFFCCRLSFLPVQNENYFIIIMKDVSAWYRPDNPLSKKTDAFRAPLTNLRAALENLTEHPEMSPVMRSAFENVMVQESIQLTEAFDSLDQSCNLLMQTQNHLNEINSATLLGFLAKHFGSSKVNFTAGTNQTAKLKVDSYGLILVLDYLADKIINERMLSEIFCKVHIGEHFIYFDLIWSGEFLPTAVVEAMLEEKLQNSTGELTIAGILHSMGGDIWSQQYENSNSALRLALPLAMRIEKL